MPQNYSKKNKLNKMFPCSSTWKIYFHKNELIFSKKKNLLPLSYINKQTGTLQEVRIEKKKKKRAK